MCAGFVSKVCRGAPSLTDPSQPLGTVGDETSSQGGSPCVTFRSSSRFSSRPFSLPSPHPQTGCGSAFTTTRSCASTRTARASSRQPPSTNNASILRTLVTWADVAPTKPANAANPFDPAYRFDDIDEFVRNAQVQGQRGPDDALGHAEVGERQQDAQLPSDVDGRLPELHQGGRLALLRAHRRLPVRAILRDLERVEPGALPDAAVQLEGPDRQPGGLREARCRRLRRDQGRQLEGARRDRRDVVERARQDEGGRERLGASPARSPSSSPRRTRTSSSTPGPSTRTPCR